MSSTDSQYMRRALVLAIKGGRDAHPNPRVGAVLVRKGRIVGEGAHSLFGGPHAEVVALRKAGRQAEGSTLYVTLEPCSHYGKTPPCFEAVIRAGVARVVAAMRDPFPLVAGRGFARLRQAGIKVVVGLLEKEAMSLNEDYLFSVAARRPKVTLKAAISLDGKIATSSGRSEWITGKEARRKAHELRAQSDAVLVGSGTALKDNPSLTVRLKGFRRGDGYPLRVVLDSRLRVSLRARVFDKKAKTVVFTSWKASARKEKALAKKGIRVFRVPLNQKMLSLKAVLGILHKISVRSLFVEGGAKIHASFIREKLADQAALFVSPKILGGGALSWAGGIGVTDPNKAPGLSGVKVERVGKDFLLTGKIENGRQPKAGA